MEGEMAFIRVIPPRVATGETAAVYRYMRDVLGGFDRAARIVQLFSLRPGSMRRMVRSWELAMWCGEEPRADRELVASVISRFNDCHY
jgi:alkylhydroperoxidase family enzyme